METLLQRDLQKKLAEETHKELNFYRVSKMSEKKLSGNEHVPTRETRAVVSSLTSFGTPQDDVATYLGITSKTMRKHYRQELDMGMIKTNAKVAQAFFKNATDNENVSAQIFWLKTRCGWKEEVAITTEVTHNIMTVPTAANASEWEQASQEVHDNNLNDH